MEVLAVDGLRIAYLRAGDGPPLVLVHGAAEDGRIWRAQLASLADELTVVAWDEPGAGRSSDLPPGFTLAGYADALARLIAALGLGPAHVAGLSWGSAIVLELVRRFPGLVAGVILVGGYAGWKGSLPEQELRSRIASARAMLEEEGFEPTLPGLFAGDPPADAVPLLAEIAADVRPATLWAELSMMAELDQRDVLGSIAVPTLLVWGEHDARSPVDTVARPLQAAIPDATLVVLPGAGHVCHLEQPELFDAALREFCMRPSPRLGVQARARR